MQWYFTQKTDPKILFSIFIKEKNKMIFEIPLFFLYFNTKCWKHVNTDLTIYCHNQVKCVKFGTILITQFPWRSLTLRSVENAHKSSIFQLKITITIFTFTFYCSNQLLIQCPSHSLLHHVLQPSTLLLKITTNI